MTHEKCFSTLDSHAIQGHVLRAMQANLSAAELARYSRHLLIPDIGVEGQLRLKDASVLLIGTGALGSPAAIYLAAAGVGRLGLVDDDEVDVSNLHRQVLHGESWIGKPKLESAAARLREINPHVELELHRVRFTPDNAMTIAARYDVLVDGSDNFPTRFLTNDVACLLKKSLVYGAIHRFEGQATIFAPHLGGPCYRCMVPEMPSPGSVPSCAEAGVLGVLPGIIGSIQAMETLKLILGIGELPLGKLTVYDALKSSFRSLRISRDPHCRLCGASPTIDSVANAETLASIACAASRDEVPAITTDRLREILNGAFDGLLIDVREPHEHAVSRIDGARLIPLRDLPSQLAELPRDREIIVHCKSGARSARAVKLLLESGFPRVTNVQGGIDAWLAGR
jgi:molybdopterin/thiamine biosynthesis adenylyltransferase/rhodanese-related sulfurtransferase